MVEERPVIPPHGLRCQGKCGGWYPPDAVPYMFSTQRRQVIVHDSHVHRAVRRRLGPLEWTTVCNSCLQTKRDHRKREGNGRLREKARKLVERHRSTFSKWIGREISREEMQDEYLYDLDVLVHDMEHALQNSCWWCGDEYKRMGHGPDDITLDVDDPKTHRAERTVPVYGHDARFCCKSCNSRKRDLTREQWKQVCVNFRRRRTYQMEIRLHPPEGQHVRLSFLDLIGFSEEGGTVAIPAPSRRRRTSRDRS